MSGSACPFLLLRIDPSTDELLEFVGLDILEAVLGILLDYPRQHVLIGIEPALLVGHVITVT